MRTKVVVLVLCCSLFACGESSKDKVPKPDLSPALQPDEPVLFEARLQGKSVLAALRDQLSPAHEAMVPRDVFAVIATKFDVPQDLASYVDQQKLHVVKFREHSGDSEALAFGFRLHKKPEEALSKLLSKGGPRNGMSINPCGGCAAVLLGDVVVVASSEKTLSDAAGYLATEGLRKDYPDGVSVRVPQDVLSGLVKKHVRAQTDEWMGFLNKALEAEQKRHAAPPELGDPVALLKKTSDAVLRWTGFLADLGDLNLHVGVKDAGLLAKLETTVTLNSPLANEIDNHPVGPLAPLLASLDSTSIALLSSGPSKDSAPFIATLAGKRLSAQDKLAIEAATKNIQTASNAVVVSAGASDATTPYLMMAMPDTKQEIQKLTLKDGVSADYITGVLGMMRSCKSSGKTFQGDSLEVCDDAYIRMAGEGDDFAMSFGPQNPARPDEDIPLRAVKAMQPGASSTWRSNDDLIRLFGEDIHTPNVIVSVAVSPSGVPAAATIVSALPKASPVNTKGATPSILSVLNDGEKDGRQSFALDFRVAQGGLSPLIHLLAD